MRKQLAALFHLKALHPDGRFKYSLQYLQELAQALGLKTGKTLLEARLVPLEKMQLVERKDGCIYLAPWDAILQKLNLPKKQYERYELNPAYPQQTVELLMLQKFWREEKARFEKSLRARINKDAPLQLLLKSVCSSTLDRGQIAYSQLQAYCNYAPGEVMDEDSEYLLLYAHTDERKYYIKGDTHVSTQHLSTRLGYSGKNGFCHYKKKLQEAGLIVVKVREYEIKKGCRTTANKRMASIGTFFFDPTTRTQKLRMVDAVEFLRPAPINAPKPLQNV